MRQALASAVGGERFPITHRVQIPGLGARGRGDRIENTVAVGVGQNAAGEIGEFCLIGS